MVAADVRGQPPPWCVTRKVSACAPHITPELAPQEDTQQNIGLSTLPWSEERSMCESPVGYNHHSRWQERLQTAMGRYISQITAYNLVSNSFMLQVLESIDVDDTGCG